MDIVTKVLEEAAKQADQFKSINVGKHLELEYDLGTLLALDTNDLDFKKIRLVLVCRLWLYVDVSTLTRAFGLTNMRFISDRSHAGISI
jgi:hypothetical protein